MLGLAMAHAGVTTPAMGWLLAAAGAFLIAGLVVLRQTRVCLSALCAAMILLGVVYGQLSWRGVPERANLPPREARLEVKIDRVFHVDETDRSIGLGRVAGTDQHLAALRGQRIYWALDATAPVRGEVVEMLGILTALPAEPEADSFEAYLKNAGVGFSIRRAGRLGTVRAAPAYYVWCDRMQTRLAAVLGLGLENRPELAGVLRAMTLGQKDALAENQQTLFRISGTMHLLRIRVIPHTLPPNSYID